MTAAKLQLLTALRPKLALVLGSGFVNAVDLLQVEASIPFAKLPGFPRLSVSGHVGKVVTGLLSDVPVIALQGRAHFYEGHAMEAVTFPIRVLAEFGVEAVLLTNAAGGINRRFKPGDFMSLSDHINFMGANPLRGAVADGQTRFVDLTQTYDPRLQQLLGQAARKARVRLHTGVYLAVSGPSYETPAEICAFARLGAGAVGMSTVPEAVVARQCGLQVAGLSCITNFAAGRSRHPLSHEEVLGMGAKIKAKAGALIENFAKLYAQHCQT